MCFLGRFSQKIGHILPPRNRLVKHDTFTVIMKIAVTGASGYISSHIIRELLKRGHQVRGLVRDLSNKSKYEYMYQFEGSSQLEFVDADYEQGLQGIDEVIHTGTSCLCVHQYI